MSTTSKNSEEPLASLTSRTIEWLRFPMAALVVLLHTGALGINSTQPVYRTLCILSSGTFCRLAVPCFFFVSGYLFFNKMREWNWRVYADKLRKRVRTLLVPYILWNAIAAVLIVFFHTWRVKKEGGVSLPFFEQVAAWGSCWGEGLFFDGPLWFIRYLMTLCLLAPLVWWLVRRLGVYWLGVCAIVLLFYPLFEGVFTFSAGAFFQVHGKDILGGLRRCRVPAYILSLLLLAGTVLAYDNASLHLVFRGLFIICGIVAVFNLVSYGLEGGALKVRPLLGQSSFFIFAAHNIIILHEAAHWAVLHLIPGQGTELFNCIDLFLRPTIAVMICVLLYWLMSKFTPKTLALLTGGRARAVARG